VESLRSRFLKKLSTGAYDFVDDRLTICCDPHQAGGTGVEARDPRGPEP
jgi:hypothetical protein